MSSYLDKTGLTSLWSKIKSSFVAQEDGNVAIEGSLTVDETNVLTAIETASMTASSLDTSEKIYLIGATSQEESPQTYSHDTVYVGTDGNLYSPILYEDDASLVEKYIRWNYARVGHNTTVQSDKTWYKFADTQIKAINTDRTITFKVCTGYGDAITRVGILTAHIRSSATLGRFNSAQLVWEYASSGIDTDNFVLLYKSDEDNGVLYCELWVNCAVDYQSYHFTVLQECSRSVFYNDSQWNLYTIYDSGVGKTSYTDGYTAITSTLNTLLNPISDLEDSGWTDATLSAGSTAFTSASLQYRTIGKQLYIRGQFTSNSALSSGSTGYLVASLIGEDGITLSGAGAVKLSSTSTPCIAHMYNDGVTYLNFYFPATVSSGTTVYFDLSGTID